MGDSTHVRPMFVYMNNVGWGAGGAKTIIEEIRFHINTKTYTSVL